MEANELMIGDWVNFGSFIRQVIQSDYYQDVNGDCVLDGVKPIPLTAEILKKNGWKRNIYNTCLELVVGTIHVGWGFYHNCITASDWAKKGDCQIASLRCEFVHELQHALRLCGLNNLAHNFKV